MEARKGIKPETRRGFHRLGILVGALCAAVWITLVIFRVIELYGDAPVFGLILSFFLPWGTFWTIPWVMDGFAGKGLKLKEKEYSGVKTDQIEKADVGNKMNGISENFKSGENQETDQAPNQINFSKSIKEMERKIKRTQVVSILVTCLFIVSLIITVNLIMSTSRSKNQILIARGLIIQNDGKAQIELGPDKYNNPRIKFISKQRNEYCTLSDSNLSFLSKNGKRLLCSLGRGLPNKSENETAFLYMEDDRGNILLNIPKAKNVFIPSNE